MRLAKMMQHVRQGNLAHPLESRHQQQLSSQVASFTQLWRPAWPCVDLYWRGKSIVLQSLCIVVSLLSLSLSPSRLRRFPEQSDQISQVYTVGYDICIFWRLISQHSHSGLQNMPAAAAVTKKVDTKLMFNTNLHAYQDNRSPDHVHSENQ